MKVSPASTRRLGTEVPRFGVPSNSRPSRKRQVLKRDASGSKKGVNQLLEHHSYKLSTASSFSNSSVLMLGSASPSVSKGVNKNSAPSEDGYPLSPSRFLWGQSPVYIAVWIAQNVVDVKQRSQATLVDSAKVDDATNLFSFPIEYKTKIKEVSTSNKGNGIPRKHSRTYLETFDPSSIRQDGDDRMETRSRSKRARGSSKSPPDISCLESPIEMELTRIRSRLAGSPLYEVGIADNYFEMNSKELQTSKKVVNAGKLILNVLSPIFEPKSDINWDERTNLLIKEFDESAPNYSPFIMAFAILAENKDILNAAKVIVEHFDSSGLLFKTKFEGVNETGDCRRGSFPFLQPNQHYNEQQSSIVPPEVYKNAPTSHFGKTFSQHPSSTLPSQTLSLQTSLSKSSQFHNHSYQQDHTSNSSSKSSPTSVESPNFKHPPSTTAGMARTSGRIRKPTLRAQEADLSVLGKGKGKKAAPKTESAKKVTSGDTATPAAPEIVVSDETGNKVKIASPCRLSEEDEWAVNQLLELASAAVAPDFEPEVEVDLAELRRKFYVDLEKESPPRDSMLMGRLADPSELDRPELVRPHTDENGWVHTGRVNYHGEEYVQVPATFSWWRPAGFSNVNMPHLRQPPPRMRSCREIERDKIFGFPPPIGQRNLP